jgi:hypothetical protein
VPGLHKLYSLAAIYHLNPQDILRWYDIPLEERFHDGDAAQSPQIHLLAPPTSLRIPMRFDPAFDPRRTEFLSRMVERWGHFEGVLTNGGSHYVYGYIGMSDRRRVPLLRPGSIVLVDASIRKIDDGNWTTEHDRPMYFVEIRNGYRCGWFYQDGSRLVMQPPALPLLAGNLAHTGRGRSRRARDRNGHALKRAGEYSSRRISSRARRFEQKRSLR